jgi:prevent-host-death family protein
LVKEVIAMSEPAISFNIHEAKTQFSRLVERVESGEEIIINRAGTPVARLVPLTEGVRRRGRGTWRGLLTMSSDWDSPEVNAAIAADFGLAP